jgi:phage terminase small subunit
MEKKLTIKQTKFVKEVVNSIKGKNINYTQAAIKAGYSKKTARFIASENLTKPYIKNRIEKVMSEEAKKLGITVEYVLNNIKQIAENENEKVLPTKLKANELLGKHLKMFHDSEIDVTLKEHQKKEHDEIINKLGEYE